MIVDIQITLHTGDPRVRRALNDCDEVRALAAVGGETTITSRTELSELSGFCDELESIVATATTVSLRPRTQPLEQVVDNPDVNALFKTDKTVRIKRCSDPLLWYSNRLEKEYKVVRDYPNEYIVRDNQCHLNIIYKRDADVV